MSGETRDSGGVRFDFTGWVGNSLIGFLSKSLVFCEGKSDSFEKKSESRNYYSRLEVILKIQKKFCPSRSRCQDVKFKSR